MPGIVGYLATTVFTRMLADNTAILAQDDALGIGVDLDRATDRARVHRVFVIVEPHQARLRHRGLLRMEPVEAAGIRHKAGTFRLEYLPDRLLT